MSNSRPALGRVYSALKTLTVGAAVLLCSLTGTTDAHAASITLEGTTTGCFGAGCSTFVDTTSSGRLAFDGNSFVLEITDTGAVSFLSGDFGTLSRTAVSGAPGPFTLLIDFTAIGGVAPDPGSITTQEILLPGVNVQVDWPDTVTNFVFSNAFGTGGFGLVLNDTGTLNPGNPTAVITPTFSSAFFRPAQDQGPGPGPSPVPEPTSLVLLGSGLVLAANGMRRRWRAR